MEKGNGISLKGLLNIIKFAKLWYDKHFMTWMFRRHKVLHVYLPHYHASQHCSGTSYKSESRHNFSVCLVFREREREREGEEKYSLL